MIRFVALFLLAVIGLSAQTKVPPELQGHRVWAIVPLIGTGKPSDPIRPSFVPSPDERRKAQSSGERPAILSYTMQFSDDKKFALVQFVGPTRESLKAIAQSADANVKAFDSATTSKEQVEATFKQYKKSFNLDSFSGKLSGPSVKIQQKGAAQ